MDGEINLVGQIFFKRKMEKSVSGIVRVRIVSLRLYFSLIRVSVLSHDAKCISFWGIQSLKI